jgi:arabinose-5-phosphate isomerase
VTQVLRRLGYRKTLVGVTVFIGVDVRTLGIADVMTTGGIRVRPGTLAVDVLNLMQSRHITSVMVADGDQLLGVVHMHDLLRAGVV